MAAQAQKQLDIPDNRVDANFYKNLPAKLQEYGLDDLTKTSDSLVLRIWRPNQIIEVRLRDGKYSAGLTNWIRGSEQISHQTIAFRADTARMLMDSLLAGNILEIPDDTYRGIDGSFVFFEVATPEHYRLYSYWSPSRHSPGTESTQDVVNLLSLTQEMIDLRTQLSNFVQNLEPDFYRWGMSSFRVDRFLPDSLPQSSLYESIEARIKNELQITEETSNRNFPYIILNGRSAFLKDLNQYEEEEVKKLEFLTSDDPKSMVYGTVAQHGLIIVETN